MSALPCLLLVLAAAPDRLTGDWKGSRTTLEDRGITIDLVYTAEAFTNFLGGRHGPTLLGHIDAALTLDTARLGLWQGGKLFLLGQNNHGTGVNSLVGSANTISNAEDSEPFTQLTELFFEQTWLDDAILIRLGKQDASRDFALSPYGSDFINNNFGMFPTSPLPNYLATGLGAVLVVQPFSWLVTRAAIFEGRPLVGSVGFDSAFRKDSGFVVAAGLAGIHRLTATEGTTSFSAWRHADSELPQGFNWGFFVQHDQRVYADPANVENEGGLVVTLRFAWAMPDRTQLPLYAGAALTWRGLFSRDDDSVGLGFGAFIVRTQAGGTAGPGSELFFELFYKLRVTRFFSAQPTVQLYRSPGGDGANAILAGVRVEIVY